jgi:hypothetical protein
MQKELGNLGITSDQDADLFTALVSGLISQQLANDPGGQRWRRLIPRVISMFADDLDLPGIDQARIGQTRIDQTRKKTS